MNKQNLVSLAIGTAFAAVALSPAAHAAGNPFGTTQLSSGYQLAQADTKAPEGKCGAEKKAMTEKKKDGKCGEAKCGADKKAAAEKKMKDGSCGADKK